MRDWGTDTQEEWERKDCDKGKDMKGLQPEMVSTQTSTGPEGTEGRGKGESLRGGCRKGVEHNRQGGTERKCGGTSQKAAIHGNY